MTSELKDYLDRAVGALEKIAAALEKRAVTPTPSDQPKKYHGAPQPTESR